MKQDMFAETAEFAAQLCKLTKLLPYDDSPRMKISNIACSMSFEHWDAVIQLLQKNFLPSAVIVHRAQFETMLRSVWVLYAASEEQLGKLSSPLDQETEHAAKNLPQVANMLATLKDRGPPQIYHALNRFKENSWKALNSYAHAGIHPIRRHEEGYPIPLIESIAKNANGLAVLAAMQAAILSGVPLLQRKILDLADQHSHCMPPSL